MNEPADKDDVKMLADKLDGLRVQNSIEHGSLFSKMTHLGSLMGWLKDAWRRFSILPPPPPDPPEDDTQ